MLDAARWTANDAPYLWIFAGRDAAQWRKVAGLAQQAGTAVLPGSDKK